jgi:hypothetical protein
VRCNTHPREQLRQDDAATSPHEYAQATLAISRNTQEVHPAVLQIRATRACTGRTLLAHASTKRRLFFSVCSAHDGFARRPAGWRVHCSVIVVALLVQHGRRRTTVVAHRTTGVAVVYTGSYAGTAGSLEAPALLPTIITTLCIRCSGRNTVSGHTIITASATNAAEPCTSIGTAVLRATAAAATVAFTAIVGFTVATSTATATTTSTADNTVQRVRSGDCDVSKRTPTHSQVQERRRARCAAREEREGATGYGALRVGVGDIRCCSAGALAAGDRRTCRRQRRAVRAVDAQLRRYRGTTTRTEAAKAEEGASATARFQRRGGIAR